MTTIVQTAVLLAVKPLDFADKKTGEMIRGVKLVLARPSENPRYEGYGMSIFDLLHLGDEGLAKAPSFIQQAAGLYMRYVDVECDILLSGNRTRFIPLSIAAAVHKEAA